MLRDIDVVVETLLAGRTADLTGAPGDDLRAMPSRESRMPPRRALLSDPPSLSASGKPVTACTSASTLSRGRSGSRGASPLRSRRIESLEQAVARSGLDDLGLEAVHARSGWTDQYLAKRKIAGTRENLKRACNERHVRVRDGGRLFARQGKSAASTGAARGARFNVASRSSTRTQRRPRHDFPFSTGGFHRRLGGATSTSATRRFTSMTATGHNTRRPIYARSSIARGAAITRETVQVVPTHRRSRLLSKVQRTPTSSLSRSADVGTSVLPFLEAIRQIAGAGRGTR